MKKHVTTFLHRLSRAERYIEVNFSGSEAALILKKHMLDSPPQEERRRIAKNPWNSPDIN